MNTILITRTITNYRERDNIGAHIMRSGFTVEVTGSATIKARLPESLWTDIANRFPQSTIED